MSGKPREGGESGGDGASVGGDEVWAEEEEGLWQQ
jgi:hypothetical protein